MSKNPDNALEAIPSASPAPSITELAGLFLFIGLTSFGGGITAYIRRLVVSQKRWLTDEEFLPGLGLVQLLPGANVVGLAVYIGNHLKGPLGSAVALGSLLVCPFISTCALGFLYFHAGKTADTKALLAGITAAACGLMASMVFEAGEKAIKGVFDIFLIILTFALVRGTPSFELLNHKIPSIPHLSVPMVILIVAPLAVWWHRPRPKKELPEQIGEVKP
ncbi:MAG: chromate transporter [Chthoniobacterales bacterium]